MDPPLYITLGHMVAPVGLPDSKSVDPRHALVCSGGKVFRKEIQKSTPAYSNYEVVWVSLK